MKKAKPQDDPNYVDLKNLRPGEAFSITAALDESVYGVPSVTVPMKIDEETGLAYCLGVGCPKRGWSSKKESTSFFFALKHVHASHCPDRLAIVTREDADGTAAQLTLRPKEIGAFFREATAPPKRANESFAAMRAKATAASAAATSTPPPPPPPVEPPAPALPPPPIEDEEMEPSDAGVMVVSTQTNFASCPGVILSLPSQGCSNYPFQLHAHLRLSFSVSMMSNNGVVLHSLRCEKDVLDALIPCRYCALMAEESIVVNIAKRSHDEELFRSTCNSIFLTTAQLIQRAAHHSLRSQRFQLVVINQNTKVLRLCKVIEDYKRLHLALAQNNVPRFRALMHNMMKRGASPKVWRYGILLFSSQCILKTHNAMCCARHQIVLREVNKAINGMYRACSYTERETKKIRPGAHHWRPTSSLCVAQRMWALLGDDS